MSPTNTKTNVFYTFFFPIWDQNPIMFQFFPDFGQNIRQAFDIYRNIDHQKAKKLKKKQRKKEQDTQTSDQTNKQTNKQRNNKDKQAESPVFSKATPGLAEVFASLGRPQRGGLYIQFQPS